MLLRKEPALAPTHVTVTAPDAARLVRTMLLDAGTSTDSAIVTDPFCNPTVIANSARFDTAAEGFERTALSDVHMLAPTPVL